ncbi:MAG: hypothetical protein QOJ34_3208 [Pseudonocardiales bacterium]|nr:hypothetical protein [Pseudonocardiales bacterium]
MSDHATTSPQDVHRPWWRRVLSKRITGWIVAATLACVAAGVWVGIATSGSATTGQPAAGSGRGGGFGAAGGASNARSGPAAGGSSGTVDTVSGSTFTVSTSAGQQVTVNEASSTTYRNGASTASAAAVTTGAPVLVLGTTSGTTITATQVLVQPPGGIGSAASAGVVPFQRGATSTSKQVGTIPANYTEGSGTIVAGTPATKATEAALAAYPGGIVDRVVQLSNGEYEVHYIGVNWPHHIFVSQSFQVVGAN